MNKAFKAQSDKISLMISFIIKQAIKYGFEKKDLYRIELTLEEALVNIINYAYEDNEGLIDINVEDNGNYFEVILKDKGIPFNPLDKPLNINKTKDLQDRKIGGLGIYFIKEKVDKLEYSYEKGFNIFKMQFEKK